MQKQSFNWQGFLFFAFLFRFIFFGLSWFSYFALIISSYQFILLFLSINFIIPVRYLAGAFMCLQMLIGPTLAFNGLDDFQIGFYKMQVPESVYFSYAIPAVIAFILGLHYKSQKYQGEKPNLASIKHFVKANPQLPYFFIGIGFLSSFISIYLSSDLAFVFVLLSCFKFIGLFLIVIGFDGIRILPLTLVFGSIVLSSIAQGMFHDLIIWLIFLSAIYALKFKPNNLLKISFVIIFIFISIIIQQLKGDYRSATWIRGEDANVETFAKTYEKNKENNKLFSSNSLAESNLRINQGYIITNVMKTVPYSVPFQNGDELVEILKAAFLPRFIAPDKLKAGDRDIFYKFSGIHLALGTSMGLSSLSDAYINFGIFGGCIFMFFYGFLFNLVLKLFATYSVEFPIILLFTSLVFYYPIRPDCELQTILGHLFKSCFLVFIVFLFWSYRLKLRKITS